MQKTYRNKGMTCAHCVSAVHEEVGKVDGVESVDVDLSAGTVSVAGRGFGDDAIRVAVDEAGYQLLDA